MRLTGLVHSPGEDSGFRLGPLDLEGPDDRPWLILGASGSGKSTLLRLLGGARAAEPAMLPDLGDTGERGYLPQSPERVFTGRNLAEDLLGVPDPDSAGRSRARELLARVGLEGVSLARPARTLSAGEGRRLALALMLASGRRDWALDEPDAGLDAVSGGAVLRVLESRASAGRLWIATHRLEFYLGLGPWAVVLEGGQVAATGELGEILRSDIVNFPAIGGSRPGFSVGRRMSGTLPEPWSNVVKKLRKSSLPILQVQSLLTNSESGS